MENAIYERVKMLKDNSGLTDTEFCKEVEISTATLHNIRTGKEVSKKKLFAIADAFTVRREWLINGEGSKEYTDKDTNIEPMPNGGPRKLSQRIVWLFEGNIQLLQDQIEQKDKQIANLLTILSKANFLKLSKKTGSAKIVNMNAEFLRAKAS